MFILFVLITPKSICQVNHWESIFYSNETFKYKIVTNSNIDDEVKNWRESYFDDQSWEEGQGGFGRGDNDDSTIINRCYSVYIRKTFFIEDTSNIQTALLNIDYDDGFVAYINGIEIARANMPADSFPEYRTVSIDSHEANMYRNGLPESFFINKLKISECLVEGNNVIAVQVHNESFNSSDLSSIIFLSVGLSDNSNQYKEVPYWFASIMEFNSSDLPLVVINTGGVTIPDEPRIIAHMGIIDNPDTNLNYVFDSYNEYDGRISIEKRGHSSQFLFPDGKISYALETQDEEGNNNNISLLGMPKENDWILYAPYSDKTLLRNVISYKLGNDIGQWAPRTRYVDVIVNGKALGIFVLLEKIKIDNNRVDIAKLDEDDIAGDSLTGGYIVKVDWPNGVPNEGWDSPYPPNNSNNHVTQFVLQSPKADDIKIEQLNYIREFITNFEASLLEENFTDQENGYRKLVDFDSFVDFMLIGELLRDTDAFRCSMYMYKDRDNKDGKLHMGPLWDFNYSMGNYENCNVFSTSGWAYLFNYECNTRAKINVFWWERLMEDINFRLALRVRWDEMRQNVLHTDTILSFIDRTVDYIDLSQKKNFGIWPILDEYIWPNSYVGGSYENEIHFLKNWLSERLIWLDENLPNEISN
ncbi:CotH kinase family protein, partial [Bacteroidota bacterium]